MNEWVNKLKSLSRVRLCDSIDCNLPGSSVHGILHARILEWVAVPFSRESSQPRDQTQVSHIAGRSFNIWVTSEVVSGKLQYSNKCAKLSGCVCYENPELQK